MDTTPNTQRRCKLVPGSAGAGRAERRRSWGLGFAFVLPFCGAAHAQSPAASAPTVSLNDGSLGTLLAQSTTAAPTPLSAGGAGVPGSTTVNTARSTPSLQAINAWKGVNVAFPPPPPATLDDDLGGVRTSLANAGIGYFGFSQNTAYVNVLNSAKTTNGQQVYTGQQATGYSQNLLGLTYDLSRYGIPDGQIVAMATYISTSWEPLGPNSLNLGTLSYYQTLFNKKVEIKIGLLANSFEYIGPYVAGSLSGGVFGPSGSIFFETGLSGATYPTYGFNVTVHPTEHIYDKFGVARSINPDGTIVEHHNNPTSTNWTTSNSGGYFINELGYLKPSAQDDPRTWVRGGTVYNNSGYSDLDHPGHRTRGNYALYLLADQQVAQISSAPGEAYRGYYVGASAEYAPPSIDRFSQYYELRLYGLGVIPGRPRDQVSLLLTETAFSKLAVDQARAAHRLAHSDSKAITLSYSALIINGLFANVGVGYTNNPSPIVYTRNTGSDLNAIVGFSAYF